MIAFSQNFLFHLSQISWHIFVHVFFRGLCLSFFKIHGLDFFFVSICCLFPNLLNSLVFIFMSVYKFSFIVLFLTS